MDGGEIVVSMVARALLTPGWRAVRKRLPRELRELMPFNPPEDMRARRVLLQRLLRERRRLIADAEAPAWRVSFADLADAAGVHVDSIRDWAADSPRVATTLGQLAVHRYDDERGEYVAERDDFETERGKLVVTGGSALQIARELWPKTPPATIPEAIERLAAHIEKRKQGAPPEPTSTPAAPTKRTNWRPRHLPQPFIQFDAEYLKLGEGNADPTVEQLAEILTDPDQRKKPFGSGRVRQLLAKFGMQVPEGGRVPARWLESKAGLAFWAAAYEIAEKKYRYFNGGW